MPTHDITAQSIHGVYAQIDNYDSLHTVMNARLDLLSDSIRYMIGIDVP